MATTAAMVKCRCPRELGGCGKIRGEAANGSQVRLQCPQCRIKFVGVVSQGVFKATNVIQVGRRIESTGPPRLIG